MSSDTLDVVTAGEGRWKDGERGTSAKTCGLGNSTGVWAEDLVAEDTVSVIRAGRLYDEIELLGVRDGIVGTTDGGRLISLPTGASG